MPCGGWCPKGRRAEDGRIPDRYPLQETTSWGYPERTKRNVQDSDGTLILQAGPMIGGTALTELTARVAGKTVMDCSPDDLAAVERVRGWITVNGIEILNVAGPRESTEPIYQRAKRFMDMLLRGDP